VTNVADKIRILFFACFVSGVAGCVTQRTILINDRGEELTCQVKGWGFIGSLASYNKQDECVAEAAQRGYRLKEPKN
jgi:hypothetical protein